MPIEFTVDLPDDNAAFDVVVYDTIDELNAMYDGPTRIGAVTERHTRMIFGDATSTVAPDCGTIRFCRDRFTIGIISHEATHMAVNVHQCRAAAAAGGDPRAPITLDASTDEDFAWTVGEIVRQIVVAGFEHSILQEAQPAR